ncbi:hypothetical protein T11_11504 [Trichinella zimbabwensis]|uniref:Uncharacterized protein n=1 Tax=Trichinella zimbabwensis TaxID=268475 RepID=A0A0V1GUJ2_9BILA|nr:hypothetical protein T11_11504 [Trichinella zimbabwensis]
MAEKPGLSLVCGFGSRSSNQMSTSKRVGGRNVHSDGDGPDENNKAEADPPTVTANPLQQSGGNFSAHLCISVLTFLYVGNCPAVSKSADALLASSDGIVWDTITHMRRRSQHSIYIYELIVLPDSDKPDLKVDGEDDQSSASIVENLAELKECCLWSRSDRKAIEKCSPVSTMFAPWQKKTDQVARLFSPTIGTQSRICRKLAIYGKCNSDIDQSKGKFEEAGSAEFLEIEEQIAMSERLYRETNSFQAELEFGLEEEERRNADKSGQSTLKDSETALE